MGSVIPELHNRVTHYDVTNRVTLGLFCKIIIQLSSTGIFIGLGSRGPPLKNNYFFYTVSGCLQSFN